MIEELKNKIPNKEIRFKEVGIDEIKKYYEGRIENYEYVNLPINIVLTKEQTQDFKNKTIPNITNFYSRTCKARIEIEKEFDTWYEIENKERKRFIKILSAMQTIEDISLEVKEIIEQVSNKVIMGKNTMQILAPEIIRIMEIFELNDVCIDKAHELSRYLGELLSIAQSFKDEETFNKIKEKIKQIYIYTSKIDFPSIRKQVSKIEEIFVNKYRDTNIMLDVIVEMIYKKLKEVN